MLTPNQVAAAFSRALRVPCTYEYVPSIEIRVPVPPGYREQLLGIEILFGRFQAPYFPPSMFQVPPDMGRSSFENTESYEPDLSGLGIALPDEARQLWGGWRGIEEYAGEAFLAEEEANGTEWMMDKKATSA